MTHSNQSVYTAQTVADNDAVEYVGGDHCFSRVPIRSANRVVPRVRPGIETGTSLRLETGGKVSKQHELKCRGDSYSLLTKMENSHTGAQSVTRDDEEDVSKKQEEGEEADETAELAGVENDEDESAVATSMRGSDSSGITIAMRKHHHQHAFHFKH